MSNPKITAEYSNTQLTLPLEVKDKNSSKKDKLPPKFKPYNNKQSFFIHNLEELIPEHHAARVVEDMVESIPDEQLFVHYSGGGRPQKKLKKQKKFPFAKNDARSAAN